ncbi:MAG: choice-of-anchor D domain-containing protein [bacterium]
MPRRSNEFIRVAGRVPRRVSVRARLSVLFVAMAAAIAGIISCSSDSPNAPDACGLSTTSINFGTALLGRSLERSFTITNTGNEAISGAVSIPAAGSAFSVVIGGGAFELVASQTRTVVVRFTPAARGAASASVQIGAGCGAVECSGVGDIAAQCIVSADTIEFGDVAVGDTARAAVTITNAGGQRVGGTLADLSECISPEGPFAVLQTNYDLAAGDSITFPVLFLPQSLGVLDCVIDTGSDSCPDVFVRGAGVAPPVCELDPIAMTFDPVAVGESATRTLAVTNTGSGTIAGVASLGAGCGEFTIEGSAIFSLATNETREFVVRFAPAAEGPRTCVLDLGTFRCDDVEITATGGPAALCVATPSALEFGEVIAGESASLPLSIENMGGGTVAGTLVSPCAEFEVVGGASFTLPSGASQDFTVRFAPSVAGAAACTLSLGDVRCAPIVARGTAVPPPACDASPASLDFGTVDVDATADRSLVLTNTGGGIVAGTASSPCAAYTIVGDANYSLGAGASDTITVRFAPTAEGVQACAIDAGSALCGTVDATGTGFFAAACELSATAIDFGTIGVGQNADRALTIRNTGGSVLAGAVSEACGAFAIVGDASYALTAGQSRVITVRFTPDAEGAAACTLATGAAECESVTLAGAGSLMSACSLSVSTLQLGTLTVGQADSAAFTMTNTGGGTLAGEVTVPAECAGFSIVGDATYSLAANQSQQFIVRYAPTDEGDAVCTIDTGAPECSDVSAIGAGFIAPACSVSLDSLDFGTVTVGEFADRVFKIANVGGSTVAGTVSESCAEFEIVGDATYSLTANQSQEITVRYAPASAIAAACAIETGAGECADIAATGAGEELPLCDASPESLAFGTVTVGDSADLVVAITNTGGGLLEGTATESCGDFSIVSGANYSLGMNASSNLTVRFKPTTNGAASCVIDAGSALCADIIASGDGFAAPECSLSTAALAFGSITVGACDTLTVTIFNTGIVTLGGNVSEACADFSIVSGGGAFSLTPGLSREVRVKFAPGSTGAKNCTLDLGTDCADVSLSGTGTAAPVCMLSTTSLAFGSVNVNSSVDMSFTITNTGGATFTGSVSEACSHYSIISGGGAFSLAPGAPARTVTVRFTPTSTGLKNCTINVAGVLSGSCDGAGADLCGSVSCSGTGVGVSCATSIQPLLTASCITAGCHATNGIDMSCSSVRANYVDTGSPASSLILLRASGQHLDGHGPFGMAPVNSLWDNSPAGSSYSTVLTWITQGALP